MIPHTPTYEAAVKANTDAVMVEVTPRTAFRIMHSHSVNWYSLNNLMGVLQTGVFGIVEMCLGSCEHVCLGTTKPPFRESQVEVTCYIHILPMSRTKRPMFNTTSRLPQMFVLSPSVYIYIYIYRAKHLM